MTEDLMSEKPPASLALEKMNIPHTVFRHTGQVSSLEQAASERAQRPEQVVRSIVFRIGEGEYLMGLVGGPAQISWKKLRAHVGKSRIRMASEEEVLSVTGYRVGTVSPFGLPKPLKVLIDPGIMREEEISTGSGLRNTGLILRSSDLLRSLENAEIVSLTETS